MIHQQAALEDTVFFWFASNDAAGSGNDGSSPAADVRLAGTGTASAAPVISPTPELLSHANFPSGAYEVAVQATAANGFAAGNIYSVFATLTVDAQTPTKFIGSFDLLKAENQTATQAQADRNATLIESQRGSHTWQGNLFYVDPVNGASHAAGNRGGRNDPYASVQDCHDNAVVDSNHDVIILVSGAAIAPTTLTEAVTISKRYTFIRGPGRDFIWTRSGSGDTIAITADGVEISGIQIGTAATGAGDGVDITDADFIRIHNCWFLDTQGDGIHMLRGSNCRFHDNHFEGTGVGGTGQGIHIVGTAGSSNDNQILDNHFANTAGDSILIESGTTNDTNMHNNVIHNSSGWAINIGASSIDAQIHCNVFGNNASGDITDAGTDTIQVNNEQWATSSNVWDEVISASAHNAAQSAGKRLRQATSTVVANDTAETSNSPGINQIQLATGESSTDGTFDPGIVCIIGGAGQGQSRLILEYTGATRIATLNRDWKIAPDGTSEYIIIGSSGGLHVNEGLAQGGTTSTITLNTLASSTDNVYVDQLIFLVSGTGQDQVGRVTAYNGTTKVATLAQTWDTTPDATTAYIMVPDAPALFQGYESAAIWIDTVNGSAGIVNYENGTAENPVSGLADATTLATALGFSHFIILPGSTITLGQSYDNHVFSGLGGNGWTLALGGQSISGSSIMGATVSGIATGANIPTFIDCSIGSATIPASRLVGCALTSSIICSAAGTYIFDRCFSGVAGTDTPDIDFGAAVGNTNLNFRHYSGGIEIKNMGATGTDNMSLEGFGQLVINANSVGGTIAIRGLFTITNNGSVTTINDDARIDTTQINDQIWAEVMSQLASVSDIPATPTLAQALMLLYMRERNDFQTTTSERRILNDAGVEVLDAPMSDNGAVFSQGKLTDA